MTRFRDAPRRPARFNKNPRPARRGAVLPADRSLDADRAGRAWALVLFDVSPERSVVQVPDRDAGCTLDAQAVLAQIDLPAALRQMRAATQAPLVVVVYGFGSRQVLARLDNANVIALAAPVDPAQIARICQLGLSIDPAPTAAFSQMLMRSAAARRYNESFLQQLSQMPSKVQCECLNHLSDLLNKLNAFERYSLECESTSSKDAAMHAMMYSASGHCREFLEEVLQRLMVHEGIPEPKA